MKHAVCIILLIIAVSCTNRPKSESLVNKSSKDSSENILYGKNITVEEKKVAEEPTEDEYKTLPGDHGREERIKELMFEAKEHKYSSLLNLGMADTGKIELAEKIAREISWDENDPGYIYKQMALAKLGDIPAYSYIIAMFNHGNFEQQEAAAEGLGYINTFQSIGELRKELSSTSEKRMIFPENKADSIEAVYAPPLRFTCLRVLNGIYPNHDLPDDENLWAEKDIIKYISFLTSEHGNK